MPYKDPIKQKQWHDDWYREHKEHCKARDATRKAANPEAWRAKKNMLDFDCNRGLGSFDDDPALLFKAFLYLVHHKNIPTIS